MSILLLYYIRSSSLQYLYDINYLWYGPIGLVLCLVVGMMASLLSLGKKCGCKLNICMLSVFCNCRSQNILRLQSVHF